jgi:hypothetical protein
VTRAEIWRRAPALFFVRVFAVDERLAETIRAGVVEFMEARLGRRSMQAVSLSSIDAVGKARHSMRKSEKGYPPWRNALLASMTLLPRFS